MAEAADDPRCPECGEPIGRTATYCMHCSADLTDEREAADANEDGVWDSPDAASADAREQAAGERSGRLLRPDGLVDDTLTVVVGIGGGIVVGAVGTAVLLLVTESGWALVLSLAAWLGVTAYLVRRRTVQDAVSKSGYAVAIVLSLVPVIALSPAVSVDGGSGGRGGLFLVLLLFSAVPAGIAAAIGWAASRFVPGDGTAGTE
ncbi:MAG: zinc ribbon domain-containing protein [Halobacteriaceae archaeon]